MNLNFDDDGVFGDREVRLFPTTRISSIREAEIRATAALLAMVRAVGEFGRAFVRPAGGIAGRISSFTEVSFSVDGPSGPYKIRPDGIVRIERGKRQWVALLEVKVGDNPLEQEQFDEYLKFTGAQDLDSVITISNQPALANGLPPLSLDRRRLRKVAVVHYSWERLLSEARVLSRRQGIEDSDQEWMLNEWIRYVADPESKIVEPPDLGPHWNPVLQAAQSASLAAVSPKLADVVGHWHGFERKAALRLRAELGVEVEPRVGRSVKNDPEARVKKDTQDALSRGILSSRLQVPDAAGDVSIDLLMQARRVRYGIAVDPPTSGRQNTRISWLVRQLNKLENPPSQLNVTVEWDQRGLVSQARLADLKGGPESLLRDAQQLPVPKESVPREFHLHWTQPLRKGRGRSSAPLLDGVFQGLETFYREVVQGLVPFVPHAPKLAKETAPEEVKPMDELAQESPNQAAEATSIPLPEPPSVPGLVLDPAAEPPSKEPSPSPLDDEQ